MTTSPHKQDPQGDDHETARDHARRGIELCRRGDWEEGFYFLSVAAESGLETGDMPSEFFAFLGYGLARYQDEVQTGLKLCRRAVEIDGYQTAGHYLLARTYLLAGDRRSAVKAVERGLRIDATSDALLALKAEMGARRPPVLPFLSRRNILNRTLGRLRHRLVGARQAKRPDPLKPE